MSAVCELESDIWPYAVRYAWNVVRGLPPPEREMKVGNSTQRSFTRWTPELDEWLKREYGVYRDRGELHLLAKSRGLTVTALQSRAPKLGLTRRQFRRVT